jgi:DNA-binding XRE family transcriptional regulator
MLILKHKSLTISAEEILEAICARKAPAGTAISLTENAVVVEPLDCMNLFGDVNSDYVSITYNDLNIDKPWSELFAQYRAATGLSQVAIGKKLGIPRRTIENWESGESVPPEYVQKSVLKAILALN